VTATHSAVAGGQIHHHADRCRQNQPNTRNPTAAAVNAKITGHSAGRRW